MSKRPKQNAKKAKSTEPDSPGSAPAKVKPLSVGEVAKKFLKALKAGDYEKAESFWSDDVVSIENMDGPMQKLAGREAVHGKSEWWFANHDVHEFKAKGPYVNGDQFALVFKMDVTRKADGERIKMEEVALYKVKRGQIVEERFLY